MIHFGDVVTPVSEDCFYWGWDGIAWGYSPPRDNLEALVTVRFPYEPQDEEDIGFIQMLFKASELKKVEEST